MTKKILSTVVLVGLLTTGTPLVTGHSISSVALAQESKKPEKPEARVVQTVSKKFNRKLKAINKALDANDNAAAMTLLKQQVERIEKLNAYEQALVWQMLAGMQAEGENYKAAAQSFENALSTGGLPVGADRGIIYNVAQLYMATEQFNKAIERFESWFELVPTPGADPHAKLAMAYAQVENYPEALPLILSAIELGGSDGPETWYKMAIAMSFSMDKVPETIDLIETAIERFPQTRDYWMQLVGLYLEQNRQREALSALHLAQKQGFLNKTSEFEQLGQMLINAEVPYKSATFMTTSLGKGLMDKSKENYELIATSWLIAREYEKSIPPMKQAAALSDDGELYARLGQTYFAQEDWGQAVSNLNKAIAKGSLSDPGNVYLLIGIASHNKGDKSAALKAFEQSGKHQNTKDSAFKWMTYLGGEN